VLPSIVVLPLRPGDIAAQAPEGLRFAGCDANLAITRLLGRAFTRTRPHVRIQLETVGSTNGIALAAAGAIHIGLSSRPLRDGEEGHEALLMLPFALGLSDLGTITIERLPIKALTVDGVAPTLENVASGRYPFVKTLAFVWREDVLPASGRAFVEFVRSPEAAAILTAHGYLPVP